MNAVVRPLLVIFLLFSSGTSAWSVGPLPSPGQVKSDVRGEIQKAADRGKLVTNWFMEHPAGDPLCVHCRLQHPQGDPTQIDCIHLVAPHASDPSTIPCKHCRQQHAEGDDTGARIPCVHRDKFGRPQHSSDPVRVPCVHLQCDHPNGDPGPPVPCTHARVRQHDHDNGPPTPCAHKVCDHPNGDQGKATQCIHPLRPVEENLADGYRLFITDNDLRAQVKQAILDLKNRFGIYVGRPRILNVFNHAPINGIPADGSNPNWSQYDPVTHSIQLMKGKTNEELAETVRHELGHALIGRRVVQILTPNGEHTLCDDKGPGLAMSEGWANFVGLVLSPGKERTYKRVDWEDAHSLSGCMNIGGGNIPYSTGNELRVAAILWDIYDANRDQGRVNLDRMNVSFQEMYKVFSPSMATLLNGPVFESIDQYMERLNANAGGQYRYSLADIRKLNLTRP